MEHREHTDAELSGLLAGKDKHVRLLDTPFTIEKASDANDLPVMAGYVSTSATDLANDIVEPAAFKDFLYRYKANNIYCFQHDTYMPIGSCDPVIDGKGLYLDNIRLANIPVNRDYIGPLVREGVLKQQSIGFMSLKGAFDSKGVYHHEQVYLLECSLVSVACNPEASIDRVKALPGFEDIRSMDDLLRGYNNGTLRPLDEVRKHFSMFVGNVSTPETPIGELRPASTAFADVASTATDKLVALSLPDGRADELVKFSAAELPLGKVVALPPRWSNKYDEIHSRCFAAKKEVVGANSSYMFQYAVPISQDGAVKVSWPHVAVSMYKLMGAKSGLALDSSVKAAIISTLSEMYRVCGMATPRVKVEGTEVAIEDVDAEFLPEFKDIMWMSGEDSIFEIKAFTDDFDRVCNILQKAVRTGTETNKKAFAEVLNKYMAAMLDIFVSVENESDAQKINQLLAAYLTPTEEEIEEIEDSVEGALTPRPEDVETAAEVPTTKANGLLDALLQLRDF